jgi:hypothetical protein
VNFIGPIHFGSAALVKRSASNSATSSRCSSARDLRSHGDARRIPAEFAGVERRGDRRHRRRSARGHRARARAEDRREPRREGGRGINLASITHQGRKLARWSLEFKAGHGSTEEFTPENGFEVLCGFAQLGFNAGGAIVKGENKGGVNTTTRAATPVAIRHQLLAIANVDAMVIEDIDWPEEQDDKSYVMTWSVHPVRAGQKINVTRPMQGDVLNGVGDAFSGAKGAAPASSTSPQLPQPPPAPPSATKPKP